MSRRHSRSLVHAVPELLLIAGSLTMVLVARGRWVNSLSDLGDWFSDVQSLTGGARIFRDVRIGYGPLSIEILAEAARIFGKSVRVIAGVEFVIGVAAVCLFLHFSRRFLSLGERILAAAIYVGIIIWMPGTGAIVFPYAPAASIGLLFLALALETGVEPGSPRNFVRASVAGVFAGLAFATKQEMGIASAAGLAVAALLARGDVRRRARFLACEAAASMLTVAAVYAYFFRNLPFLAVARLNRLWPFGSFPTELIKINSFVAGYNQGERALLENLACLGLVALGLGLVVSIQAIRVSETMLLRRGVVLEAGGVAMLAITEIVRRVWLIDGSTIFLHSSRPRFDLLSLAPAACVGVLVVAFGRLRRPVRQREVALATLTVPAALLLIRVGFVGDTRSPFAGLGYTAVVPVVVACLTMALGFNFRGYLRALPGARRALVGILVVVTLVYSFPNRLRQIYVQSPESLFPFRSERGTIWITHNWRSLFSWANDVVATYSHPGGTVAFLPETHGMDFLFDRRSATPLPNLLPGLLDQQMEAELVDRWSRANPDLVVILEKDYVEFETRGFGLDYGYRLRSWIDEHYSVVDEIYGRDVHGIAYVARTNPLRDLPMKRTMGRRPRPPTSKVDELDAPMN